MLFLVVVCYYWIGATPFADLTAPEQSSAAAGGPAQLLVLAVFGALVGVWWFSRHEISLLEPRLLLMALLGWFLLTAALAPHPDLALRRVALAAIVCVNAGVVLLLPRSDREFALLLGLSMVAMLGLAYYAVFFTPRLAIHQPADIGEPMLAGLWRGHFIHKNVASSAMALACFFGLYIMKMWSRGVGLLIVVAAVYFLTQTGGKTSTAMLPAILLMCWAMERWRWTRVPIVVGGVALFNVVAVGSSISDGLGGLVSGLGVDPTFTNRADIWRIAVSGIIERPLTGFGFQSFWGSDELVYGGGSIETWAVSARTSHNGYIETLLAGGLPALALTVIWLVVLPLRDFAKAQLIDNNPALTRLFARIWLYGILTACVESVFYYQGGGMLWFSVLIAVFGLRFQSRARLVQAPSAAKAAAYG